MRVIQRVRVAATIYQITAPLVSDGIVSFDVYSVLESCYVAGARENATVWGKKF